VVANKKMLSFIQEDPIILY